MFATDARGAAPWVAAVLRTSEGAAPAQLLEVRQPTHTASAQSGCSYVCAATRHVKSNFDNFEIDSFNRFLSLSGKSSHLEPSVTSGWPAMCTSGAGHLQLAQSPPRCKSAAALATARLLGARRRTLSVCRRCARPRRRCCRWTGWWPRSSRRRRRWRPQRRAPRRWCACTSCCKP